MTKRSTRTTNYDLNDDGLQRIMGERSAPLPDLSLTQVASRAQYVEKEVKKKSLIYFLK